MARAVLKELIERVMPFYEPALGNQACDRKARRQQQAWLPTPSGKPGKGPAIALHSACGIAIPQALCALSSDLSPVFAGV